MIFHLVLQDPANDVLVAIDPSTVEVSIATMDGIADGVLQRFPCSLVFSSQFIKKKTLLQFEYIFYTLAVPSPITGISLPLANFILFIIFKRFFLSILFSKILFSLLNFCQKINELVLNLNSR